MKIQYGELKKVFRVLLIAKGMVEEEAEAVAKVLADNSLDGILLDGVNCFLAIINDMDQGVGSLKEFRIATPTKEEGEDVLRRRKLSYEQGIEISEEVWNKIEWDYQRALKEESLLKKLPNGTYDERGYFNIGEMGKWNQITGTKYMGKQYYKGKYIGILQYGDQADGYRDYQVSEELIITAEKVSSSEAEMKRFIEEAGYAELAIKWVIRQPQKHFTYLS